MIENIGAPSLTGFGLYNCPNCGRGGLPNRHAPCPSCGGDVTVAKEAGQAGMTEVTASERGESGRSLADELKEQQRQRLEPHHQQEQENHPQTDGQRLNPRTAATAMEADIQAASSSESTDATSEQNQRPDEARKAAAQADGASAESVQDMSARELAMLRELQERDREVRSHEQAHISAGGDVVTGGASYSYQTGPDGRQYATGGEVSIDTSPVPGDPEATMEKARTIRRAALAPASPSSQDQQVAARASQMEAEARMEKIQERQQERGATPDEAPMAAAEPPSGENPLSAQETTATALAALLPPEGFTPTPSSDNLAMQPVKEEAAIFGHASSQPAFTAQHDRALERYAAWQQHEAARTTSATAADPERFAALV